MCVIAFSPKGVDIPTVEQLKSMWQANPDGAGYAYTKGGKVIYRKGFMTLDALLAELSVPERFKNTNFAIHFRIGTSGKNDGATCHPFPVSTDFGTLRRTEGEADSVLFHNGVIGKGGIVNPLSSDTQDLVVAIAPLIEKYNKSKARDHYLAELTSGNRILVLYKSNAFKMYGDWKKDGDIWVSNLSYKTDYHWDGYGYDSRGWWEDWYENYCKKPADAKEETKIEEEDNELVTEIWNEIIRNEYAFVNEAEMSALKKSAQDYSVDELYKEGYTFGYCNQTGAVWLVSTPDDIKIDKED